MLNGPWVARRNASEATTCCDLVYLKLTGLGAETFPNLLVE